MSEALEIKNLFKTFPVGKKGFLSKPAGYVHAVDGVSLSIKSGETLGIVGESGCGKSTLGRVMTHLLPATDGQVLLNGVDVTRAKGEELQKIKKNNSNDFSRSLFFTKSSSHSWSNCGHALSCTKH